MFIKSQDNLYKQNKTPRNLSYWAFYGADDGSNIKFVTLALQIYILHPSNYGSFFALFVVGFSPTYNAPHCSGFPFQTQHKIKSPVTYVTGLFMGRMMGFEPTHKGTTILGLNRLTTSAISYLKYKTNIALFQLSEKNYLFLF